MATRGRQVVLVNMPFASVRWPHLGLGLLQAAARARGFPCHTLNLNFDLAERIGLDLYQWLADQFAFVLGGERFFAQAYFGTLPTSDADYAKEVLRAVDPHLTDREIQDYFSVAGAVEEFLRHAMAACYWNEIWVVGFSTTFQQTMPSLALARRIKEVAPQVVTVFGGAACEGEMGLALIEQFPEIDYVFLGEADESFPAFLEWLSTGNTSAPLPAGVVGRQDMGVACAAEDEGPQARTTQRELLTLPQIKPQAKATRAVVEDLNALPPPDFDDYFARYRASFLQAEFEPALFFEMSRGCWWGQKHHCAFCGLNGESMLYRSKSPEKVLEELRYLVERHSCTQGCAADNILDMRYFSTLLPELERAALPFRFACELKANLTRPQVGQLLRAGLGAAQLGIETFASDLLARIHKGARGYQNLQTLKWFSEAGIQVQWNWLFGIPGETAEHYQQFLRLIPLITHFHPPLGVGRMRMDRFSPFFERPTSYGLTNARAAVAFHHVYPFPQDVLDRLAYYFEFDFANGYDPQPQAQELVAAVNRWHEEHAQSGLSLARMPTGELLITDTRPAFGFRQCRLRDWQADLYEFCDTARSEAAIQDWLQARPEITPAWAQATLRTWCQDGWMLFWDERYLSLGTWVPEQSDLAEAANAAADRVMRFRKGQHHAPVGTF